MLRAIREIQPRWIVGENVPGLLNWGRGLVLDEIKADLEAAGFGVFPPLVLPACSLNAPHRRDRIWIVAHSRLQRPPIGQQQTVGVNKLCEERVIANTSSNGHGDKSGESGRKKTQEQTKEQREEWDEVFGERYGGVIKRINVTGTTPNADNKGLQRGKNDGGVKGFGENGDQQPARFFRTDWQDFPTQSPVCNGNDGLPAGVEFDSISKSKWRNQSLMAAGNAVVPGVVYEIFKAIEKSIA